MNGRTEITLAELKLYSHMTPEEELLALLKKKGAPIKGNIILELDYSYEWERINEFDKIIFKWSKI